MLFILNSHIWSITFFFIFIYSIFLASLIIYLIPVLSSQQKYNFFKKKSLFTLINWTNISNIILFLSTSLFLINSFWVNSNLSVWFGHLIVYNLNLKITYINLILFYVLTYSLISSSYFSSKEIYDYIITIINLLFWVNILFYINSIFSSIFVIEVLSTIIFLMIITSNYSTTYYYNSTNLSKGIYSQQIFPHSYLQSLLFYFWVSLLASLNLFLFVNLLYMKIYSFDWFLIEHIFTYYTLTSGFWTTLSLTIPWFIFVSSIFIKCGLVPFFFWKPIFFKGLSFHLLYTYICYFYLFFFLFVIHLLTSYFSEIYYYYLFILVTFLISSIFFLLIVLCESYYIKIFLAMSSILNSILVFIGLSSLHYLDFSLLL